MEGGKERKMEGREARKGERKGKRVFHTTGHRQLEGRIGKGKGKREGRIVKGRKERKMESRKGREGRRCN